MIAELTADQIDLNDLPQQLQTIADIIGLPATLTLVKHYGGVRLYVPMTVTPEHILSRLIGFDTALKLAKEFGGMDHFDIPRAAGALRTVRNRRIVDKFNKGKSLRELALEFVMTERMIVKILSHSGATHENRQANLF
ncbi:Mor transcription activator family protein [Undibacterium sp. SXout11W]|uniref:Mor transcription activator family protein n=1 Tax=Undibacterium sp. SXout11W TaxID=3413050 RepID=UPI003BF2CEFD